MNACFGWSSYASASTESIGVIDSGTYSSLFKPMNKWNILLIESVILMRINLLLLLITSLRIININTDSKLLHLRHTLYNLR